MKKKCLALLLTGVMISGFLCGGCGNSSSQIESQSTQEASTEQVKTALGLMKHVNTEPLNVIDDKYRTFYEVFVYSFCDSDGDGIGDLKGLTQKLDYINDGDDTTDTDLGCNGIWLMPIMPSTTYHKYDVTNYEDIDPEYGTMEDFETFVEEAHNRGINVIIDLVMNHSSSKHPWFVSASDYLKSLPEGQDPDLEECPYVDYYNFSKEKKSGYVPLEGTDWYYEAQFWSEMPDLNLGNEAVRAEFEQIVDFWLAKGVDGFRLDAVKEFYSGADDKNIEVLSWFNEMVKSKDENAYLVGEAWNDISVYSKYYESGMDSLFDFSFANSDGVIANVVKGSGNYNASSYGKALVNEQETFEKYSDSYIDAPFYSNHDMARSAGYYSGENSEAQTKMGHALNLLMTGNAFLYYGEELGMKGSGKDENKRAPMYWSEDASAEGMCTGPKDMDSVKMKYGSLDEQASDDNSIYSFVKEIIKLRNTYPEIARGEVSMNEDLSNENVCVIQKTYNDQSAILVFNISAEDAQIDISGLANSEETGLKLAGELLTGDRAAGLNDHTLEMPAYSVVILK